MPELTIPSDSKEYVKVPVAAREAGVVVNPTADVVQMAFITSGKPQAGDWKTAGWETDSGRYYARALVGPGGVIALNPGNYDVWIKIIDSPETVVRKAGELTVT